MSSSFVCERPRRLWQNSITVGTPARTTSAASCSGPDGSRCDVPRHLEDRLVAELDQLRVEEDRLDRPDPSKETSIDSSAAKRSERLLRVREHRRQRVRVEVALVEQLLGGLHDRSDDAGLADDAARRADRAAARALGDMAKLERELRGARERVTPRVHRRRAGVRGLASSR